MDEIVAVRQHEDRRFDSAPLFLCRGNWPHEHSMEDGRHHVGRHRYRIHNAVERPEFRLGNPTHQARGDVHPPPAVMGRGTIGTKTIAAAGTARSKTGISSTSARARSG